MTWILNFQRTFSIFIIFRIVVSFDFIRNQRIWSAETNKSIRLNIKRKCDWKIEPGLSVPTESSKSFFVSVFQPNENEFRGFNSLPNTLVKANSILGLLSNSSGFTEKWSKSTKSQWVIPYDHVAQNRSNCYKITNLAAKEGVLDLYQNFKSVHRTFYLLRNKHAVIHPSGSVMVDCGYYQGAEGCETRWGNHAADWFDDCHNLFAAYHTTLDSLFSSDNTTYQNSMLLLQNCSTARQLNLLETLKDDVIGGSETLFKPQYFNRVFVIAALWDYNYHHFIADCLARMARNIKFLRANVDIRIHIRSVENYDVNPIKSAHFKANARLLRDRLVSLLGINPNRFVWGLVVAKEIFIPRAMHCAYALSNPIEMRILATEMIKGVNKQVNKNNKRNKKNKFIKNNILDYGKKNLIIQQRYGISSSERTWSNDTYDQIAQDFAVMYPDHNIVRMISTSMNSPDYCLACDIHQYMNADVLVGLHGAGMTNMMFMPQGSLIIEMFGTYKNVNMPYCGYYHAFAAIYGHHHYSHAYLYKQKEPIYSDVAARKSRDFYDQLQKQDYLALNVTTIISDNTVQIDV